MTVYFVRKIADPTAVKIGTAGSLEKRLGTIARSVGPIHLFGSMPGGIAMERKIQIKFAHLRTEGEWFKSDEELETYIRIIADKEDVEFSFKPVNWSTKADAPILRRENDARAALGLLNALFERYPRQTKVMRCLELTFQELHALNPGWTRRRVRALRELRGLRVDAFEMIDMLTVLSVPRHEWADWMDPRPIAKPSELVADLTEEQGAGE